MITPIRQKLPELIKSHPEIRKWVLEVVGERFADCAQTEGRFEQMLAELRQTREESERRRQEQPATWRQEWQAHREEDVGLDSKPTAGSGND